jgi:hypothetical protein
MEIDVEDIESLDPPEEKEEPWCYTCHAFTDYRRKWDTFNRADLDGGFIPKLLKCHIVSIVLSLLPSQSRKALHTWNQAKRDQSIQDLLQKL